MQGRVFILGAGASHGDTLKDLVGIQRRSKSIVRPPLIDGFFRKRLWEEIGYAGNSAAAEFRNAFSYITQLKQLGESSLGEGNWQNLNLEEVFTALEIEREFQGPESAMGGFLTAARNELVGYIGKMLAFCHQDMYGIYTQQLVHVLDPADSILTFNYDLLMDQVFLFQQAPPYHQHYSRFFNRLSYGSWPSPSEKEGPDGMLLKLHGSLNWFRCTNPGCPGASKVQLAQNTQECLSRFLGIHSEDETCLQCGSEMVALIVPPLLKKPIINNWIFRSIWGMARRRLQEATEVFIIGYSAPPSDFYASWLLQSTIGPRKDLKPIVVNPANSPTDSNYESFRIRMNALFPHGYDGGFLTFDQLGSFLAKPDSSSTSID